MLCNMRFGRKKETREEAVGGSSSENGGGYADGSVNSNAIHKKPTDLAVYEQFEMQVSKTGFGWIELNLNEWLLMRCCCRREEARCAAELSRTKREMP